MIGTPPFLAFSVAMGFPQTFAKASLELLSFQSQPHACWNDSGVPLCPDID
jgi:hypothetical protein